MNVGDSGLNHGMPDALSEQARSIWAKTNLADPGNPGYLQLWQHLEDTAFVSDHVWNDFLPNHVRQILIADLGGENAARTVVQFLCGVHDVGKASPAFEMMNQRCATRVQQAGLVIETDFPGVENRPKIRHELVGYDTLIRWLESRMAPDKSGVEAPNRSPDCLAYTGLANVVGGHHGMSISADNLQSMRDHSYGRRLAGISTQGYTSGWQECRFAILDWMADATGFTKLPHSAGLRPLTKRVQALITAIVIICDWIASNTYYFPLNESWRDEESFDAQSRAYRAWHRIGIPGPWQPPAPQQDIDSLFSRRFSIPNARLRPMQREAVTAADNMQTPSLMIIEANMGEGKTEAALLAAERLAAKFHLGGVYYALPTQATANAMFSRFVRWIDNLPAEHRPLAASLFLAHGKRELNDEFTSLKQWGGNYDVPEESDAETEERLLGQETSKTIGDGTDSAPMLSATVNSWLSGRKRGNLSDFVVGTIDQVLMAGLRSKHVVLRHLSLAGKVVILDEVHANTAYMNVFMETVLAWLAYYEVPVIMLSATLPRGRRKAYLNAYAAGGRALSDERAKVSAADTAIMTTSQASGAPRSKGVPRRRRKTATVHSTEQTVDLRYPLISTMSASGTAQTIAAASSGRSTTVQVKYCDDSDDALVELLRRELVDGGCAVVIRNTVSRAQHTYELIGERLAEPLQADVELAHSRFLAFDRARIDRDLVRRYGPNDKSRPRCAIVVATQVAEQSLDVDFDLMVTDMAPIDLILQRTGRLHRHRRGDGECLRPPRLRQAQLYITGISEWKDDDVPAFDGGVEIVYGKHLLLRSLAVLGVTPSRDRTLEIPAVIPELVQTVYGAMPVGPDSWQSALRQAEAKWNDDQSRKKADAEPFRIITPSESPCDLDGWLERDVLEDPEGHSERARRAMATVRDSDESVEVVVLQRASDGLQLPSWGDFRTKEPLPNGMAQPSPEQIRDILSCSISLNRYSAGCSLDGFIEGVERCCTGTDAASERWMDWQQSSQLTGQLLLPLDEQGCVSIDVRESFSEDDSRVARSRKPRYRTMTYRYSPEVGWSIVS